MEEERRQIQSHVDAHCDPDHVSWADLRCYTGSQGAGDVLVPSLARHASRQIKEFKETKPAQRRFRGHVSYNAGGAGGHSPAPGGKVQAPGTDAAGRVEADKGHGRGRGRGKKDGGGSWPQCWVTPAALRRVAWNLEVLVWRCRARLPNVLGPLFLKCLTTAHMLVAGSPRGGAIIGELNETVFWL